MSTGTQRAGWQCTGHVVVGPRTGTATDREPDREVAASTQGLRVRLVGGLEVHRGGELLGARQLGGAKPRLVLVALVLSRGRPVSKDRLVEMLWGEEPPAEAVAALESYVSVLRSRLAVPDGRRPVVTVPHGYAVDPRAMEVDVWRSEVPLGALLRDEAVSPEDVLRQLQNTLAVLDGPLLPHEADLPWLQEARQRHDRRLMDLRADVARCAGLAGRWDDVLRQGRANAAADPLDERSWALQMRAYLQLGRPVEALRAFELCRRELRAQLGCAPGPQLQQLLIEALRATDSDDDLAELVRVVVTLSDRLATRPSVERHRILLDARRAISQVAQPSQSLGQG